MRESHDRHLFVRINFTCADTRKMFQAAETSGALKPTHVNSRVTENFARRASERSRVKSVRKEIAIFGHDRHHGGEVDVETEHAQHFAGDSSEGSCGCKIAVLAYRARGRHRRENPAEAIDEATFLIDSHQWRRWYDFTDFVEQGAELLRTCDVASEDDDSSGLHFLDQRACLDVELRPGKS